MTVERRVLVLVPSEAAAEVRGLQDSASRALARAAKAPPGDRVDIIRFEALSTQLERLGIHFLNAGQSYQELASDDETRAVVHDFGHASQRRFGRHVRTWRTRRLTAGPQDSRGDDGAIGVSVSLPLLSGLAPAPAGDGPGVPDPCEPWKASPGVYGRAAVKERFETQVGALASGAGNEPLAPSGVANRVLTDVLHTYAVAGPDRSPVLAPVRYRDGSMARPFPLGCLNHPDNVGAMTHSYSFTLMSMRHVEMDYHVDGAWLRNTEISRPRPMADTDEIAYLTSMRQLDQLILAGSTELIMYQTGLEPAVLGFYRAVTELLARQTGVLAVSPRHYHEGTSFAPGATWAT